MYGGWKMKKKKPFIPDIKLTEKDIEVSLLQLKRRVGPPILELKQK
jgi:hypothetical protein|tara:strand:+ start:574 stop:711 length:138 start_codon:yes stop_codon:yes gene_type:complete